MLPAQRIPGRRATTAAFSWKKFSARAAVRASAAASRCSSSVKGSYELTNASAPSPARNQLPSGTTQRAVSRQVGLAGTMSASPRVSPNSPVRSTLLIQGTRVTARRSANSQRAHHGAGSTGTSQPQTVRRTVSQGCADATVRWFWVHSPMILMSIRFGRRPSNSP